MYCGYVQDASIISGTLTTGSSSGDDSHDNPELQQMYNMHVFSSVFIVDPGSSKKKGSAESLLHTVRVDQSVTEAAL